MSDIQDRSRRVIGSFLKKRRRPRVGCRRPNWEAGKNVFRLFPFEHTVNEWDVLRDNLGFTRDDIGENVRLLAVPVLRYYLGGKGGRVVNGLNATYDCPIFREWCETPKEARKRREGPNDFYAVNVLDMTNVGDGIRPFLFTRSEWLGTRDRDGTVVTYGIYHLIAGYPLGSGEDGTDDEEDFEFEGPDAGGLRPFEGYGDAILGPNGRDIVVFKTKGRVGSNECLLLDRAKRGGPTRVMPLKDKKGNRLNVEIPERMLAGVKDLLLMPDLFPGWANDGGHIEYPDDPDLVTKYLKALKLAKGGPLPTPQDIEEGRTKSRPELVEEDPPAMDLLPPAPSERAQEPAGEAIAPEVPEDLDEEKAAPAAAGKPKRAKKTKTAKKAPARKRTRKRTTTLTVGARVLARDIEEEDGVEVETVYKGKVHRLVDKGAKLEISLSPADQTDERAKAQLEAAIQQSNTNVFIFDRKQVERDPEA